MAKKKDYQLLRYWFTPLLCSYIVGYVESLGYSCRHSCLIIFHNKQITKKDALKIDGYMACLHEIGYLIDN